MRLFVGPNVCFVDTIPSQQARCELPNEQIFLYKDRYKGILYEKDTIFYVKSDYLS